MILRVLSIIFAVAALVLVFEMMRRRRLREKYAVLWLFIGIIAVVIAAAPVILTELARLVDVEVPSNLLFFGSILISFLVALQLSSEVGHLEEETRTLAEEVAMLELRVQQLERSTEQ